MTTKKTPALTGVKEKACNTVSRERDYRRPGKTCKVEIYREGARLTAPSSRFMGQPEHLRGIERGEIKGWSLKSRKRMREFLLTHQAREGFDTFSVTLTVPGPPLKEPEWKKLWNVFGVNLVRMESGAVWRKELQPGRQAVHWHLLLAVPVHRSSRRTVSDIITISPPQNPQGTLTERFPCIHAENYHDLYNAVHQPRNEFEARSQHEEVLTLIESGLWETVVKIYRLWFRCLDTIGPCEHIGANGHLQSVGSRSELWGANRHAVEISHMPDSAQGWNRYMLDHTTKAKQAQIAEHYGRHWGYKNKAVFEEIQNPDTREMTWQQYSRFLRAYNRLITPYVRDPDALFGKSRGQSFRRGMYGKYVTFSNPDTIRRLSEWATAEP